VLCALALGAVAAEPSSEGLTAPERRKDQFAKDFGYAAFPYPYKLPGIGSGLSFAAGAFNIADTHTDAYGIVFAGDVKGAALGVADFHLVPKTLIVDLGYSSISGAAFQSYTKRGMNTGKDDFNLIELGDTEYYGARMTATFQERRIEAYGAWYQGASRLKNIRDKDGNVLVPAQDPPRDKGHTTLLGARLDLTDDYADPRRGFRLDVSRTQSPPQGSGPDTFVMDYNTAGYIPFRRRDTLVLNMLRSDAFVSRQGETNSGALQTQLGLDCNAGTPAQQQSCNDVIDTTIAHNTFGTATQLGGFSRLRSYPQGRFKGAHTLFFGAEYRWNLTDERTPFDIFVMKDVRTSIQLAFFYETGVTSDDRDDLHKRANMRDSYGAGFRVVTASGVVFRGDVAHGKEGLNTAIFIGYPWEL
jgi:outer membrane protein assembly factor BamA